MNLTRKQHSAKRMVGQRLKLHHTKLLLRMKKVRLLRLLLIETVVLDLKLLLLVLVNLSLLLTKMVQLLLVIHPKLLMVLLPFFWPDVTSQLNLAARSMVVFWVSLLLVSHQRLWVLVQHTQSQLHYQRLVLLLMILMYLKSMKLSHHKLLTV